MARSRQMLLLVFAALLIVSAPLANAQEYDEEPVVEEVDPVATPPPAPTPAPAGSIDIEQYKALATEYLNKAAELGKVYAAQAQELATEYMGHANVYLDQATEYVTTTLDKLGIKPARKTEL